MLAVAILMIVIGLGFFWVGTGRAQESAAGCGSIIVGLVIFAAWLLLGTPARAHDAPSGWTYPLACCSDFDCREVADAAVEERPEGYVIVATGEVIPMNSRKVRPSPDGVFHWCSVAGRDDSATICLFAPPRAF